MAVREDDKEIAHRDEMWRRLVAAGGPDDVAPALVRELEIYGGQQGIWIDAERTAALTADRVGITVALLHTGRHYADDLSADSILYHYPKTRRPGRDAFEIAATKHAANMHVPVFVVTPGCLCAAHRHAWSSGWVGRRSGGVSRSVRGPARGPGNQANGGQGQGGLTA